MIIKCKNLSRRQPDFADGDLISGCNLSQDAPGTEIAAGVKGLRFEGCNLTNCRLPDDAVVVGCNTKQGVIRVRRDPTEAEVLIDQINKLTPDDRTLVRDGIASEGVRDGG